MILIKNEKTTKKLEHYGEENNDLNKIIKHLKA